MTGHEQMTSLTRACKQQAALIITLLFSLIIYHLSLTCCTVEALKSREELAKWTHWCQTQQNPVQLTFNAVIFVISDAKSNLMS